MNQSFAVPQVRSTSGTVGMSSPECDGAKASTSGLVEASSRRREDFGSTEDVEAPGESSRFHEKI